MVKRYRQKYDGHEDEYNIIESTDGPYVEYEDYKSLKSELSELTELTFFLCHWSEGDDIKMGESYISYFLQEVYHSDAFGLTAVHFDLRFD